jgi:hypothetical protein
MPPLFSWNEPKDSVRWVQTHLETIGLLQERSSKAFLDAWACADFAYGAFERSFRRLPDKPMAHTQVARVFDYDFGIDALGACRLRDTNGADPAPSI